MPATHIAEITDRMILDRLCQVRGVHVCWTGRMPREVERWTDAANEILPTLTPAIVCRQLEHHLMGDDAQHEIDMAISMACEPDDLPDGAMVELMF